MRKIPNLSISPEKVFFIVAKARQSDSKATESGSGHRLLPTTIRRSGLRITARAPIARSFPASFEV